jgi:hypothetical protein
MDPVITLRDNPFPFEAVRDLLGVVRAMYVWAEGAKRARDAEKLVAIGRMLREALALAVQHQPGTLGHGAAWQKSDRAVEQLGLVVDALMPARPIIEAAGKRVRKTR